MFEYPHIKIHEDFYRMIEFLPGSNHDFIVQYFKDTSQSMGQYGSMSIRIVPPPPVTFRTLGMVLPDIQKILNTHAKQDCNVSLGFDGLSDLQNLPAFSFGRFIVIAEEEKDGQIIALSLWHFASEADTGSLVDLVKALHNLGTSSDLLLVDWMEEEMVVLKNEKEVVSYLTRSFDVDFSSWR